MCSAPSPAALLEVEGLHAGYGAVPVLFGIDLVVGSGERVALLGTNGAGKSTLLRAIAGSLPLDAGVVRFDGRDVTRSAPEERVRRGLVLVSGGRAVFPTLSVLDNVRMGCYGELGRHGHADERVEEALDVLPALVPLRRRPAGTLSGGEQQMVAIARGLVSRPRLLMIDELSLGLGPIVVSTLIAAVEEVASRGVAVLVVEQSLNVALAVARRAYFLEKGAVAYSGPAAALVERGDIVRSVFFGTRSAAR